MGNIEASYTVEIDAPLADVYKVAADVPGAVEWNPAIQKVTVFESDDQGRATLVETEADVKVKTAKSILRFSYDDEPDGLSWVQEKGDVKSVHGRWEFTELDAGRTQAVYALDVDPGPHARHAPPRPGRRPGQDVPDEGRGRGPEGALRRRLAASGGGPGSRQC